jgi:dolichol-phosphate mannosyltransferase
MSTKRIVLILPTYNEVDNVGDAIKTVFTNFPKSKKYDCHILVADDSSPDGTAGVVRKLMSRYKNLHLVLLKEKAGLGPAYYNAMKHAFYKMNADYVFEFDADLSHDPKKIPEFLEKTESGYEYVVGTRYKNGGSIPANWGFYRKFLSNYGNLFISLLFLSKKVSDWTSGYKLISKDLFKKLGKEPFMKKGYAFQITVSKKVLNLNYKVAEIPYSFVDRTLGKSKLSAGFAFYTLWYVCMLRARDFLKSSFFKVCLVGTFGAVVQILSLSFFIDHFSTLIAHNLSILLAITSNYLLNNVFSFKHNKITGLSLIKKYPGFLLISMGSLIIQNLVMNTGLTLLQETELNIQILNVVGILLGLIVNYTLYTKLIWRKKK